MNPQKTVHVNYEETSNLLDGTIYKKVGDDGIATLKARQFYTCGTQQIPKEQVEDMVSSILEDKMKNILFLQIIGFDLILTFLGGVVSCFAIIFGIVSSQGFLTFLGIFGGIPIVIHIVDGINNRWKKINQNQKA